MLFIILFAINIFLPLFIEKDNKYWIVSILLFVGLFIAFAVWRIDSDNNIKWLDELYVKSAVMDVNRDNNLLIRLEQARKQAFQINMTFINLIFFQSFLTYVLQILGRRNTKARIYKWTVWIMGILFFFILLIRIMMGIVPTSGMLG